MKGTKGNEKSSIEQAHIQKVGWLVEWVFNVRLELR